MGYIYLIVFGIATVAYSISIVGINIESLIALACFVSIPLLLLCGYQEIHINEKFKYLVRFLTAISILYYLSFLIAVLIINYKYQFQGDIYNYIHSHPEYIFSTITTYK